MHRFSVCNFFYTNTIHMTFQFYYIQGNKHSIQSPQPTNSSGSYLGNENMFKQYACINTYACSNTTVCASLSTSEK